MGPADLCRAVGKRSRRGRLDGVTAGGGENYKRWLFEHLGCYQKHEYGGLEVVDDWSNLCALDEHFYRPLTARIGSASSMDSP